MTQDIKAVTTTTSIEQARATMKASRIRHLLVREGTKVVGIVSDRDLGTRPGARDARPVAEVMTTNVITATPETTIRRADAPASRV